jgi:hypothetical protein
LGGRRPRELPDNGYDVGMKFYLEVDVPETDDAHLEVARILRDEGEAMVELGDLMPGDKQDVYDSDNNRVGSWSVDAVTE